MSGQETFRLGNTIPDEIEKVKPSGQFNETLTVCQLVEHLKNELKTVDLTQNKFKSSFLLYILDKVKTVIIKNKHLEKDQLIQISVQVLKLLIVNITDADLKTIEDTLNILISNKIVKAVDKSIKGKLKKLLKKN
jgi:hypothetical protein